MTKRAKTLSHLDAVADILTDAGIKVHIAEARHDTGGPVPLPYVVLWTRAWTPESVAISCAREVIETSLMTTVVSDTGRNALVARERVRDLLDGVRLSVPGRVVEPLRVDLSSEVMVDTDMTLPGTRTHPAYVVDQWRLVSVPDGK